MAREPQKPHDHAWRAARFETRELEARLRRAEAEGRAARAAIEAELQREHFGRLPENWRSGPAPSGGVPPKEQRKEPPPRR
jgi:hypothetical protein